MQKESPQLPVEEEKKVGIDMAPSIKRLLLDESLRRKHETGARWSIGALIKELVLERYGHNGHATNGIHRKTDDD